MIRSLSLALTLALAAGPALGADSALDPQQLVGVWKVDLRPTPGAEPYFQEFVVESVADGELKGSFYGTEISSGRLNVDWGALHFAFVTGDGTGAYYSSGVLRDGRIEGRTHSAGRGFLSVWSAERPGADPVTERVPALHPKAPEETEQFAFLLGRHHCSSQSMRPDGTLVDTGEAEWNGRYILDGWAIEDEWISPLPDGSTSRGINIRSFDREAGHWDNRWLQTGNLQWKYFAAEAVGETMVMTGGEGTDGRGAFVDRNTFSETSRAGFNWRKDRSWDGGDTWIQGVATIRCTTIE